MAASPAFAEGWIQGYALDKNRMYNETTLPEGYSRYPHISEGKVPEVYAATSTKLPVGGCQVNGGVRKQPRGPERTRGLGWGSYRSRMSQ